MKEISRKITVDLSRRGGTRQSFAVQNDKGTRNLRISLTDDGSPYRIGVGTVAALNYKRPDGICGAQSASVVDGDVCVTLQAPTIGAIGNTVCTVSLFDGDGNKLTSSEFSLDVSEEIYSGEALDETPEYTLLDGVFSRLAEFETREVEREAAESERVLAEAERARLDAERDEKISANLGVGGSITLLASKWSQELTQSVVVSGLRETDMVVFYPSSATDRGILANYGVFFYPDTEDERVTVSAKAKPIANISLRYFITRGKDSGEV